MHNNHRSDIRRWTEIASLTREVPESGGPAAQLQVEVLQVDQRSQVGKASGPYLVAALHTQMLQLQHACTEVATGATMRSERCVQRLLLWLLIPKDVVFLATTSAVAAAGLAQVLSF